MDTWNWLTYLRGEGGWRDWERLAQEHVCAARGHRQQRGEDQGMVGAWWR